jgi:hypothetical protein
MSAQADLEQIQDIHGYRTYFSSGVAFLVAPDGSLIYMSSMGVQSPLCAETLGKVVGKLIADHMIKESR